MTLEEKALRSIAYDPINRIYYIDRKFHNYRIFYKSIYEDQVVEFVKKKFKTIKVLKLMKRRIVR